MKTRSGVIAGILGAALLLPQIASAQDGSCNAASCSTSADLTLTVTIPTFLYFRVGTAAAATVDTVTFTFGGTDVVGSNTGGAQGDAFGNGIAGSGSVAVTVRSNGGQVTIGGSADTGGGLGGGAAQVPWTEFNSESDDANVPTPTLANGALTGVNVAVTAGNITNRNANWSYEYLNTAVYDAGAYSGTVTYQASIP